MCGCEAIPFSCAPIIFAGVGGFFYVLSGIVAARSRRRLAAYYGPQQIILPPGSRMPLPRVVRAYAEIVREEQAKLTNHNLASPDAAPYGVYCRAGEAAPRRHAARQRPSDDGTGAVAHIP